MSDAINTEIWTNTAGPTGTHYLLPGAVGALEKKVARLTRRSAKLGQVLDFKVEFLGHVTQRNETGETRVRYAVTVTGEAPSVSGWDMLAKLTHTAEGTLVLSAPGHRDVFETLTPGQRDSGACDHCGTSRKRKDTFLLSEKSTGARLRVGRSCLAQFFDASAEAALISWAMLEEIERADRDPDAESGECGGEWIFTATYVAAAIKSAKEIGYRKAGFGDSTAGTARFAAGERPMLGTVARESWDAAQPSEADKSAAKAALAWIASGTEGSPDGGYGHNLKIATASPVVLPRTGGIVASLAACWLRHTDAVKKAAAGPVAESVHFGERGSRYVRPVTVTGITHVDSDWGVTTLYTMADRTTGAELKWFASRQMVDSEGEDLDIGAKIELLFTVKTHGEYREKKQTTITRGAMVTETTKLPRWINLDGQIFGSKKAMLAAG